MNYKEFQKEILRIIRDVMEINYEVNLHKVMKNNDMEMVAITIHERNVEGAVPTIYLEDFYEMYCAGVSIENIANNIIAVYHKQNGKVNLVGKKVGEYKIKSLNDSKKTVMKRGPKGPRKPKNELKPESKSQNTIEKPETEEKFLPESTKDSSGIKVPSKAVSLLKENNVKEDDMLKICKAASKTQGGVVGFEIQLQMMFGKERGIILFNKLRNIFDKLKKIVGDDF